MASAPALDTPWAPLAPRAVADLLRGADARWWLSGGAALDAVHGSPIRERENIDVSTTGRDVAALVAALPSGYTAWAQVVGEDLVAWGEQPDDADIQPVLVHDDAAGTWVLRVNVEDGTPKLWVYKRDPRLTLPWDRAVVDVDGIPTGAPEVQLVWKALRPRPEDDVDKAAVLPDLPSEAVTFFETALLRIHPHSSWSIPIRSPFAPAKASWNRKQQ